MHSSDFIIKVTFIDGTEVTLGADGELFIEQTEEGSKTCTLTDDRLALIKALQKAEQDSLE